MERGYRTSSIIGTSRWNLLDNTAKLEYVKEYWRHYKIWRFYGRTSLETMEFPGWHHQIGIKEKDAQYTNQR